MKSIKKPDCLQTVTGKHAVMMMNLIIIISACFPSCIGKAKKPDPNLTLGSDKRAYEYV